MPPSKWLELGKIRATRNASALSLNGKILHLPLEGPWELETGGELQVVLDAIKTGQYRNQTEIGLELNQATVSRRIKKATDKGLITKSEIDDYYRGIMPIETDPFDGSECVNFANSEDQDWID